MVKDRKPSGIKSWPVDDRPRERLLRRGPQALTDAELIAILLRVGVKGKNAVELARQILQHFGSLQTLAEAPLAALLDIKGLKGAKVAQLAASMEIARRVRMPDSRERILVKSTKDALEYAKTRLSGLGEEHFRCLFLNRRGAMIEDCLLATGTVNQSRPSIRAIIVRALQVNASAIIAMHNHPSGKAEASESDKLFTQDLLGAIKPIGIKLLDHLIVASGTVLSFTESGLMDEISLTV